MISETNEAPKEWLKGLLRFLSAFILKMHSNFLCFCNEPWHFLASPVESCNDSYLALYMRVGTIKETLGNIPDYPGECPCLCEAGFSDHLIDLTIALGGACLCLALHALWQSSSSLWMYECSQISWFKVKSCTTWGVFLLASAQSEAKEAEFLNAVLLFGFHNS